MVELKAERICITSKRRLWKGDARKLGVFVNPSNSAFQVALNSKIYVDKSGLLEYTNSAFGTTEGLICNSRPRRFGKSITADMIIAYYGIQSGQPDCIYSK